MKPIPSGRQIIINMNKIDAITTRKLKTLIP